MIFITLGTQDKSFKRILQVLEDSFIEDKMIAQIGYTDFNSNKMELVKYLNKDEFEKYILDADIIISHGGVGSIMSALNKHKKVLACPRLLKYHEHTNDHQLQICEAFEKNGYLLVYRDGDDINKKIEELKEFNPKEFISNNENFVSKLSTYLNI